MLDSTSRVRWGMKAIRVAEGVVDGPLTVVDLEDPKITSDSSVLIKVAAFGVNRADLLQRAGVYPAPAGESNLMGLEVCGTVECVGCSVRALQPGDRVCALLAGGGYAERVVVDEAQVFLLPARYSFIQGAALPEAFITAFVNLFYEGELQSSEVALIHGGSSGVGTASIQLAKRAGASVVCTVGSAEKREACIQLGADLAINYHTHDFAEGVRSWRAGGVDLVLDIVGREYFERNVGLLADRGRMVSIAAMTGAEVTLNLAALMRRRLRLIGSVLRSRSVQEKGLAIRGFLARFGSDLNSGAISPVIDTVYSMEQIDEAHSRMKASQHIGKLIVQL
jgi:putative PIG3 family NAD(P)H quinone oxidoreductase